MTTDKASGEHYFSSHAGEEFQSHSISVTLAGRELSLETAGGVFSPEHLDTGTRVLLASVPEPPATGNLLDIGCGWGPIALELALRSPEATVWAIDVNERSLELTRRNAVRAGCTNIRVCLPNEVPADLRFDAIWSNPPIRVGKAELHAILQRWLPRLSAGAEGYLVVAKQLGGDSLQTWLAETFEAAEVERVTTDKGFRVLRIAQAG